VASNGTILNRFDINTYYQDQLLPDLAFNGQHYLVAWLDRRAQPAHIYYTQVAPDGRILNSTGIKLSGNDSSDYYTLPTVASNGENYLVAWLGNRISGDVILGARIDSSGEIIDTMPFQFSSDTLLIDRVAVESDGQNYLVVWSCETPGSVGLDLYFRRFSATGFMLDSTPILIARNPQGLSEPAISYGSGYYFVVWSGTVGDQNIYGARILTDGTILDPAGFPICVDSGSQLDPAVTSDGEKFLVTWTDARTGNFDIYATLVDTSGNVGLENKTLNPVSKIQIIQISPTHFKSEVFIRFNLTSSEDVRLDIYDLSGRQVRNLILGKLQSGTYKITWDGKNFKDNIEPNGIYFCRFQVGSYTINKRIIKLY
jgi:hypothetical protein